MKTLKTKHVELENSAAAISGMFDETKKACDDQSKKMNSMRKEVATIKALCTDLDDDRQTSNENTTTELAELKDKILDLQYRSMKNNLVFSGIEELENENCHDVLDSFR